MNNILYSGQKVIWKKKTYKASSGLIEYGKDYRTPKEQKNKDKGPIPEGKYKLRLKEDRKIYARVSWESCGLFASPYLQKIPKGKRAEIPKRHRPWYNDDGATVTNCFDEYLHNWGTNRIRLEPLPKTKTHGRNGFYLHDSTKKYTHGCIEVETKFFDELRNYMKKTTRKYLYLTVKYESPNMKTYS